VTQAPAARVASRLAAILPDPLPPRRPFVIGIAGAQGSGKSTAAALLAALLRKRGLRVAILSIDDLYLDRGARERLARDVHPLFVTRGVPGTHDPTLGLAIIAALGRAGRVAVPRFDKARDRQGKPDAVAAPVDVLLLEGWCVGARPQEDAALADPINALEAEEDAAGRWRRHANTALAGDYQRLFARIDRLVLLAAPGFDVVAGWRREQERGLDDGMDDAAVARFVEHYRRLSLHMLAEMPGRADLVIHLAPDRMPVDA
jgi:D-glycerate 3-kinase